MRGDVPTLSSREINSLVRAAISGTSLGGAIGDAVGRVDRSRRSSSGGGGAGGLSSDESRCKGKNDESGEAEHMELEAWGGGVRRGLWTSSLSGCKSIQERIESCTYCLVQSAPGLSQHRRRQSIRHVCLAVLPCPRPRCLRL